MAITNTWNITQLDCYPQAEGETDVVFTAHWTLTGDDGEGHVGSVYGSVGVTYEAGEPYTPFNELTEAQVQGWVEDALGEEQLAAMKANVDGQIEDQKNPKTVTLTPPWMTLEAPAA